jgi:hypothetical protein
MYGAYRPLSDLGAALTEPRFVQLRDTSLEYMRLLGLSSGHLNTYEANRWVEMHGDRRTSFDGIVDVVLTCPRPRPTSRPSGRASRG